MADIISTIFTAATSIVSNIGAMVTTILGWFTKDGNELLLLPLCFSVVAIGLHWIKMLLGTRLK